MKKDITVIIGPTAIGKSDFAIQLAKKTNAHIISADAYQIYKGMNIGTGKIPLEERKKIPHYLIDIKKPNETYSVMEFIQLTNQIIQNLRAQNIPIIITGGTAFYINAFLHNYTFINYPPNQSLKDDLQKKAHQIGSQALWKKLHKIDPISANSIKPQNTKRIIRALEIFYQTNQLPSSLRHKTTLPRSDTKIIGLTAPRERIYQRINQRVIYMFQQGFIEEVQNLLKQGYSPNLSSFDAIGYRLISQNLQQNPNIQDITGSIRYLEMIKSIQAKTRQFAKRQLTWYKKFKNVNWITIP